MSTKLQSKKIIILSLSQHYHPKKALCPTRPCPVSFHTNIVPVFAISLKRATLPAHSKHLHFSTLATFGDVFKLWISSLCNFLPSHINFSLFGPCNLFSALFSNIKKELFNHMINYKEEILFSLLYRAPLKH
jgi:hypothetical protein